MRIIDPDELKDCSSTGRFRTRASTAASSSRSAKLVRARTMTDVMGVFVVDRGSTDNGFHQDGLSIDQVTMIKKKFAMIWQR